MQIKPYPKNAKKHPDKQLELLAKVVSEVGWRQNTEVNQDGVIVAGHGRYMAWEKYKDKYNLPPIWITNDKGETIHGEHATMPLTEEQEKMWRLADNQLNAMTDMDMELVIEELKELSEPMVELTGFDTDLLIEPDEKDDEVPEVSEEPQSKLGDLYELGNHRVLCGDSTKLEDVERLMNGKKADMVFTDPPYGINLNTDLSSINTDWKGWKGKGGKYSKVIGDDEDYDSNHLFLAFPDVKEMFIWGANYFIDTVPNFGKDGSWIVWDKKTNQKEDTELSWKMGAEFELCWSKEKHKQIVIRQLWQGLYGTESQDIRNRVHPTQKPLQVLTPIIQEYSSSEDTIVDLFLGSGSTLIACEQTDRTCYGMELDPKYIDVIVTRWCDYTGNTEVIKNGEKITWQKRK